MKKLIVISCIALLGCKTKSVSRSADQTRIFRFLGLKTYAFPPNESEFWDYGLNDSEFAYTSYPMDESSIMKILQNLSETKMEEGGKRDFLYCYAFIFPNKDTIYADERLVQWKTRSQGKVKWFSQDDSSKVDAIDYDFFVAHPFFSDLRIREYPEKR